MAEPTLGHHPVRHLIKIPLRPCRAAGLQGGGQDVQFLRGAFGEVLAVYQDGSLDYWNIVRPDGTVIGRREGSSRLYYHRDHLGSTRAFVNASGSVLQVYDYYPFGLEMPGRITTGSSLTREKFTGHSLSRPFGKRDEEVGQYHMIPR